MSSKATKKRFVTNKQLMELVLPSEIEKVAQVTASRGNNLLEVEDETGGKYLASMPTRFRNTVWVKRGHFVLLEPIEEGDKVRAEISHVLDTENILYIRDEGLWPKKFDADAEAMTRHSKRGVEASVNIDPDMLPPSESDDEDEEDTENEAEEESSTESRDK